MHTFIYFLAWLSGGLCVGLLLTAMLVALHEQAERNRQKRWRQKETL